MINVTSMNEKDRNDLAVCILSHISLEVVNHLERLLPSFN